jgi:hypothetical protein
MLPSGAGQHCSESEPQRAQKFLMQAVPLAVQVWLAQQGWPVPPQVPQAPALHVAAIGAQVVPLAMQVPKAQQPPLTQEFPAQQGAPGVPQAGSVTPVSGRTLPGASVVLPAGASGVVAAGASGVVAAGPSVLAAVEPPSLGGTSGTGMAPLPQAEARRQITSQRGVRQRIGRTIRRVNAAAQDTDLL